MWLSNSARRGVGHCCTKSASHPPRPTPSRDPLSPLKYTASALEVPTNTLAPYVSPPRTDCRSNAFSASTERQIWPRSRRFQRQLTDVTGSRDLGVVVETPAQRTTRCTAQSTARLLRRRPSLLRNFGPVKQRSRVRRPSRSKKRRGRKFPRERAWATRLARSRCVPGSSADPAPRTHNARSGAHLRAPNGSYGVEICGVT
jgi:hypothetical protein